MMSKINLKNMKSYLRGHSNLFLDALGQYPKSKQEQVLYRLSLCKNDCVPAGKCKHCGCPPHKKVYDPYSCNGGTRFPNMMNESEWEEFKEKNNIKIKDD